VDEPEAMPLPTAYCAPGRKVISELALVLKGERYAEMTEHPWLEGSTDVWLVAALPPLELSPLPPFSAEFTRPPWYCLLGPVVPASPFVLTALM